MKRKAKIITELCVACGCCKKTCPQNAIRVEKGIVSKIAEEKCFGCGICVAACPADLITLIEREEKE